MKHDNIIAGQWRKTTTPRVRTVKWKKASSDFDFWARCMADDYLRAQGAVIYPDYNQWTDRETWEVKWP